MTSEIDAMTTRVERTERSRHTPTNRAAAAQCSLRSATTSAAPSTPTTTSDEMAVCERECAAMVAGQQQ